MLRRRIQFVVAALILAGCSGTESVQPTSTRVQPTAGEWDLGPGGTYLGAILDQNGNQIWVEPAMTVAFGPTQTELTECGDVVLGQMFCSGIGAAIEQDCAAQPCNDGSNAGICAIVPGYPLGGNNPCYTIRWFDQGHF